MGISRRMLLGSIALSAISLFGGVPQQQSPPTNQTPAQPSQSTRGLPFRSPYQSIEDAASSMKAADSASIRALVDTLFKFPDTYPMPEMMASVVKQRLIDAETAYLDGKSSGVVEGSVVDAMNALANAFETPDYARVSALQVRFLRKRLAVAMPFFMGSVPEAKVDEPNPPMSPVQALFLMSTLIQQKEANPDYQVSPAEWDSDYYPRLLEEARNVDEMRRRVEAGEAGYEVSYQAKVGILTGKNLTLLLVERIRQMSIIEGLKLFNETFARLGI